MFGVGAMKGTRADIRLVELGLAESREKARSLIMSGAVSLSGIRVEKPGDNVPPDSVLTVKENPIPFVSRGGLKLDKPVRKFGISLAGAVALDIGASTGGFTDCMLQNGAKRVYAIDVGYGQLDWRLRNDPRVVVMERTNARFMEPGWFTEQPDFASMDVSFISIRLILPQVFTCLRENACAVILVKPQFEAGRGKVGKNGVVREKETHREVLLGAVEFALQTGFHVLNIDFSPITGPKGNIEFLLVLQKPVAGAEQQALEQPAETVAKIVEEAHASLKDV